MNWSLLGVLVINLILSVTGDVFAKIWATTNDIRWFYTSLSVGIFTLLSFIFVVRTGGLSIGGTVALLLTMIGTVIIGVTFFKETLIPTQWLGIVLGLVAILLVLGPTAFRS